MRDSRLAVEPRTHVKILRSASPPTDFPLLLPTPASCMELRFFVWSLDDPTARHPHRERTSWPKIDWRVVRRKSAAARRAGRMRLALRASARRLSTLATVIEKGAPVTVNLKADGLAELPITLPIHRRNETALEPRSGASMIEVRLFPCLTETTLRDW
jgi:hypothetical protein